nr:hypothetical protein [Acinetobacter sp. Marseille-Q1620]
MKKIMILPVIGCLSFSGCGGDASSDLMTDVKQTSYLMIKGEGIDEEIDIVQDKTTFDLGANGNEPLSYIFLNLNQNNPPLIGGISYSSKENKTSLDFFTYEKNGEIWGLSCFPLSICTSNSTLKIEEKGSDSLVNVQFNGANNSLVKNFIINGGDPSKLIPVKVLGNISYLAPSLWPVFQKNRFPKLDISGKTLFDDEEYLLENIEKTKSIIEGKKLTFYHFTFNNKKMLCMYRSMSLKINQNMEMYLYQF